MMEQLGNARVVFNSSEYVKEGLHYTVFRGTPRYGQTIAFDGWCTEKEGTTVVLEHCRSTTLFPSSSTYEVISSESPVFIWDWLRFVEFEWKIPTYIQELYRWGFIPKDKLKETIYELCRTWRARHSVFAIDLDEYKERIHKWAIHLPGGTYQMPANSRENMDAIKEEVEDIYEKFKE